MAQGPDLSRLSTKQLCELTEKDSRTVTKRLREAGVQPAEQDGRSNFYRPAAALEAIYGGSSQNPFVERAKLDAKKREKLELEIAEKRGELVLAADVDHGYIALATAVSARLQAIPTALALELASEGDPQKCQALVETALRSALNDLADAGERARSRVDQDEAADDARRRDGASVDADAGENDGPRVGRGAARGAARN